MASSTRKNNPATARVSRAEKRAMQRAQNPGRALEMRKFRLHGNYTKAEWVNEVEEHIYVGCSGWYYWDWKEKFYPPQIPTSQWFSHYADQFDTVELNAPFYSWPTPGTVKSWLRQARQSNFVYTVKVSEMITHTKLFVGTKTLIRDFGLIADLLGEHMGCFLFQLPPRYSYTPARLRNMLSQLDPSRRNAVEFRHASWWNKTVYKAFQNAGTIFCSCSGPNLPDELIKTADDIYVRFHGTKKWYRHNYNKEEMDVWAQRIRESGAKRVWVYFNNDYDAYAIENARMLKKMLMK